MTNNSWVISSISRAKSQAFPLSQNPHNPSLSCTILFAWPTSKALLFQEIIHSIRFPRGDRPNGRLFVPFYHSYCLFSILSLWVEQLRRLSSINQSRLNRSHLPFPSSPFPFVSFPCGSPKHSLRLNFLFMITPESPPPSHSCIRIFVPCFLFAVFRLSQYPLNHPFHSPTLLQVPPLFLPSSTLRNTPSFQLPYNFYTPPIISYSTFSLFNSSWMPLVTLKTFSFIYSFFLHLSHHLPKILFHFCLNLYPYSPLSFTYTF